MNKSNHLIQKNPKGDFIFIQGVMQRSGTNFLNNLLLLHPDCGYPGLVWEDFFLAHADLLVKYTEKVKKHWPENWCQKVSEHISPIAPMNFIGRGLKEFMLKQQEIVLRNPEMQAELSGEGKHLVTATPNVNNIELFFDLFEDSRLLIIIRDGRAVVESGVRSFDWDYEEAMRRWTKAAEKIINLDRNYAKKDKFMIVRFEDLFVATEKTISQIFAYLKLDIDKFDLTAALNLGVSGSSELCKESKTLHWQFIDKTKEFNPLSRAGKWNNRLRQRFFWIAGDIPGYFGYEQQPKGSISPYWQIWNSLMDVIYSIEIKATGRINGLARMMRWVRLRMLGLSTRK